MNPRTLELALKKQRLQIRAEAERRQMQQHLAALDAVLDTTDRVHRRVSDTLHWLRDKAPILSTALLVVLIARPRRTLRLARHAWMGWLLFRRNRGVAASLLLSPAASRIGLRLLARLKAALGRTQA
ncbi:MAG: hypothetical protein RJA63_3311 [Pseudomonadota bacterium]|jgi:hypothetical protein